MEELRQTGYKPKTTVIASWDHLCTNTFINGLWGAALNNAC